MNKNRTALSNRRRSEGGAALVTAIIFTLIFALMIGAGLQYVMAHTNNVWAKSDSEASLLLAEGGINDEMAYIRRNRFSTTLPRCSAGPTKASGEPYKGRKVVVPNVGTYWVFTSADQAGDNVWSGSGPFTITCNALVGDAHRKVKINSQVGAQGSPLEIYAIFGVNSATTGSTNAITLSNGDCIVEGTVGTNGQVGNNAGTANNKITFNVAHNCNTLQFQGQQFTNDAYNPTATIYSMPTRKNFPSITTLLTEDLRIHSSVTTSTPWDYIKANNDNDKIRMFTASNPALSLAGTTTIGALKTQSELTNANSKQKEVLGKGGDLGSFTGVNAYSGTTIKLGPVDGSGNDIYPIDDITNGDTVLIFPPGRYYFSRAAVTYVATQKLKIVIDDDWKTADTSKGEKIGNPDQKQVCFWFADGVNQNDAICVPVTFTSAGGGDASIFRFLYNKPGKEFEFRRESAVPDGDLNVYGAVYGVTGDLTKPTSIRFTGDNSTSSAAGFRIALVGALIADGVTVQGFGRIKFSKDIYNPNDVLIDLGEWGGYDDGG